MKLKRSFLILIICFLAQGLILPASADDKKPKLVLQITVDQLRGDLPMRFKERLDKGGFRYLLESGTHYNNAHYQHANTETAVGHATLATGADPSRHGIVANDWIDQKIGLDKTLIVLSADHGAPEAPEYMAEHGMETGRFPLDWFKKGSPLSDALKKSFGRDDLVAVHSHPYLYLNLDAIADAELNIEEVEVLKK